MTGRLNAFKALSGLEPVVSLHDLEIFLGITRQHAVHIAYKWRLAGYLKSFADEVYLNVVVAPRPTNGQLKLAIEKTLHRPHLLVGMSALSEAHCTTQVANKIEVAVVVNRTVRTWKPMDRVTAEGRSVRWFRVAMANSTVGTDDFRYLDPAYALVDAIMAKSSFDELDRAEKKAFRDKNQGIWHPDADDIDFSDTNAEEMAGRLARATLNFKADPETVRTYLEGQNEVSEHLEIFDDVISDGIRALHPR